MPTAVKRDIESYKYEIKREKLSKPKTGRTYLQWRFNSIVTLHIVCIICIHRANDIIRTLVWTSVDVKTWTFLTQNTILLFLRLMIDHLIVCTKIFPFRRTVIFCVIFACKKYQDINKIYNCQRFGNNCSII